MALPITVPFTFANATTTQNLSYLDSDFATVYDAVNGIGNGTVALANVNITGGTVNASFNSTIIQYGTSNVSVTSSNGPVSISTNGTQAVYVNSSGNVGIGTSSPASGCKFAIVGGNTQLSGGTSAQAGLRVQYSSGVATISGINNDNNAYNPISFYTSGTEAMRIDSSGNLLVGYTSSNGAYKLQVNSQIFATSATIATSDGRYKENIVPLDNALQIVQQLNPVQFSWKEHPVHNFDRSQPTVGFIAQEVQTALASEPFVNSIVKKSTCVITPEVKDENGNVTTPAVTEDFLGIAEGNMVALLTKALQEANAKIDALAARVAELETK